MSYIYDYNHLTRGDRVLSSGHMVDSPAFVRMIRREYRTMRRAGMERYQARAAISHLLYIGGTYGVEWMRERPEVKA